MHCPRCGQEQVAGNLKFCSKCGMPLTWVAEIIKNGGDLPQAAVQTGSKLFTRSNGLKFALIWFLLLDFLLVPLLGVLDGGDIIGVAAILGFVGAVIIAVLSALFLKNPVRTQFAQPPEEYAQPNAIPGHDQNVLSPPRQQSADEYAAPAAGWRAPDTGELIKPGSVTEGTTRLLKKEEDL